MKLEVGKFYKTRTGAVVGPMRLIDDPGVGSGYKFTAPRSEGVDGVPTWTANGMFWDFDRWSDDDLVGACTSNGAPPVAEFPPLDWYEVAAHEALVEVHRTKALWPSNFVNMHEGYAILLEELDELWGVVKMNQKKRDLADARKEAIQVAAMALRFAVEVTDEINGRK